MEMGPNTTRVPYKQKYKILKQFTKDLILENSALCDKAEEIQHSILLAQEERKFLWKKLMTIQGNHFGTDEILLNGQSSTSHTNETKKTKKPVSKARTKCTVDRKPPSKVKQKQQQIKEEHVDPVN